MSVPRPVSSITTATAIDRHVAATSLTLVNVLGATADRLEEPRAPAPELARHHLGYRVETLLGVAVAGVVGRVVSAVLRGLGQDIRIHLEIELRDALRRIGPGNGTRITSPLSIAPSSFVKDAAARPLVDELGVRLYPRLAHAGRDHHAVLTRIAAAIPAERAASFTSTLAQLDDDPMLASVWGEHLLLGWIHFAIAASNVRDAEPTIPAELAGSPSCQTWGAWLRRVRGERAAPPPPRHQGEYIMAVMA